MGCFSFLCLRCDKGIKSTSFEGDECILFLLKDGKVIDKMSGEYNSYGRVFSEVEFTRSVDPKYKLRMSQLWNVDPIELLSSDNYHDGIAAFHKECYDGSISMNRSLDDPNQGWGEEDEEDLHDNECC